MTGYLLRPCKSSAVFEALPQQMGKKFQLDLSNCRKSLEALGYVEVCDAKILLIMEKSIEVTIFPTGKLIIKTDSHDSAEQIMNEIYGAILHEQNEIER